MNYKNHYASNILIILCSLTLNHLSLHAMDSSAPDLSTQDHNLRLRLTRDVIWENHPLLNTSFLGDTLATRAALVEEGFQPVETKSFDGLTLKGLLFLPENADEIWIVTPGLFPGNKEGMATVHHLLNHHQDPTQHNKIGILLHDSRGIGESAQEIDAAIQEHVKATQQKWYNRALSLIPGAKKAITTHAAITKKWDELHLSQYGQYHPQDIGTWIRYIHQECTTKPRIGLYGTCAGAFNHDLYLGERGEKAVTEDNIFLHIAESGWVDPVEMADRSWKNDGKRMAIQKILAGKKRSQAPTTPEQRYHAYQETLEHLSKQPEFQQQYKEQRNKRIAQQALNWKNAEERSKERVAQAPLSKKVTIAAATLGINTLVTRIYNYQKTNRDADHAVHCDLRHEENTALGAICVPTVRIQAKDDLVAPVKDAVLLHKKTAAPFKQLHILTKCDHALPLVQRPYIMNNIVANARKEALALHKK